VWSGERSNGGEPLWIVLRRLAIFVSVRCIAANLVKQAAPTNVSTRIYVCRILERINNLRAE
jgi:hypothetical protein